MNTPSPTNDSTTEAPPRPFADARWLGWIVGALAIWTLVLAIGAWKGPTAKPTGESLSPSEQAVSRDAVSTKRALMRGAIVLGSTTIFLAFWGVMFWTRAKRLAQGPGSFPNNPLPGENEATTTSAAETAASEGIGAR